MSHPGLPFVPPAPADDPLGGSFGVGAGDVVAFHRIHGCDETWTLVAGGSIELHLIHPDGRYENRLLALGPAPAGGSAGAAAATTIEAGSLRAARLAPGASRAALRRAVASGPWPPGIEIPRAAEILRRHPLHRAIVLELAAG